MAVWLGEFFGLYRVCLEVQSPRLVLAVFSVMVLETLFEEC